MGLSTRSVSGLVDDGDSATGVRLPLLSFFSPSLARAELSGEVKGWGAGEGVGWSDRGKGPACACAKLPPSLALRLPTAGPRQVASSRGALRERDLLLGRPRATRRKALRASGGAVGWAAVGGSWSSRCVCHAARRQDGRTDDPSPSFLPRSAAVRRPDPVRQPRNVVLAARAQQLVGRSRRRRLRARGARLALARQGGL